MTRPEQMIEELVRVMEHNSTYHRQKEILRDWEQSEEGQQSVGKVNDYLMKLIASERDQFPEVDSNAIYLFVFDVLERAGICEEAVSENRGPVGQAVLRAIRLSKKCRAQLVEFLKASGIKWYHDVLTEAGEKCVGCDQCSPDCDDDCDDDCDEDNCRPCVIG